MYDELIKRLRNCTSDTAEGCAGCPHQGGYKGTYCINGIISDAADSIEELSAVVRAQKAVLDKFPRWIPVTERLPEPYTWVLVFAGEHEVAVAAFYDGAQWKDAILNGLIVTHWMPLPEPPKEG